MMEMFKKKEYGEMLKTTLRVTNSALSNLKNVCIILPLAFVLLLKRKSTEGHDHFIVFISGVMSCEYMDPY